MIIARPSPISPTARRAAVAVLVLVASPFVETSVAVEPRILGGALGIGQKFRPNTWTPLLVDLEGGDYPFHGYLRIRYPQDREHELLHVEPITLAPGQRRRAELLIRPGLDTHRSGQVLLLDQRRRVVARSQFETDIGQSGVILGDPLSPDNATVLVVGHRPALLPGGVYLPEPEDEKNATRTNQWGWKHRFKLALDVATCWADELPSDATGYDGIDVLIWNAPAQGALNQPQREALLEWIEGGGKFIYCPRDPVLALSDPFCELLAFSPRYKETTDESEPLRFDWVAPPNGSGEPLYVAGLKGFGIVIQLRFTPPTVRDSDAKDEFWQGLEASWQGLFDALFIDKPRPTKNYNNWQGNFQLRVVAGAKRIVDRVGSFQGAGRPRLGLTLFLCFALTVVAGPVEYLVLKRLKMLSWTWTTIPLILLVFSGAAIALGNSFHSGQLQQNTLELVDYAQGSQKAYRHRYVGIYSPSSMNYNLTMDGRRPRIAGFSLQGLIPSRYYGSGMLKAPLRAKTTREQVTASFAAPVATTRFYQCSDSIPANELPIQIEITQVIRTGDSLRVLGRITNRLEKPLARAILARGKIIAQLPRVEAGASRKKFDVEAKPLQSNEHSYGNWTWRLKKLCYADPHRGQTMWPGGNERAWNMLNDDPERYWLLLIPVKPPDVAARLTPAPDRRKDEQIYRILASVPSDGIEK